MAHSFTLKKKGESQQALMQFIAGGCGGFTEIAMFHPLDVVKTSFQINKPKDGSSPSIASTFKRIYKSQGIKGFYKGITPPLLSETPNRAIKFLSFEQSKRFLKNQSNLPMFMVNSTAGFMCGCIEAVIINPFEVVKIRQQAKKGSDAMEKSAFQVAKEIYRKDGFGKRGLNRGFMTTLCRHSIWNTCYFGVYYNFKGYLSKDGSGKELRFPTKLALGFSAGTIASAIDVPWDVAKSRIQGPQPNSGEIKYKSTIQTLRLVAKEEGFLTLYRGLLPKIMRLGPGGAVTLLVYEYVYDLLDEKL